MMENDTPMLCQHHSIRENGKLRLPGTGDSKKAHGRMESTRQAYSGNWAFTSQTVICTRETKNKLATTSMEISRLNITYQDRKVNIWVREKTKVTDVTEQVGSGHGQGTSAGYDITDGHTIRKHYEWKRSRVRPARRWRDELDDYRKGTVLQKITEDRQL